jgi:hypothetical protein
MERQKGRIRKMILFCNQHVGMAIASQVHELCLPAEQDEIWFGGGQLQGHELCFVMHHAVAWFHWNRAEVALLESGVALMGEVGGAHQTISADSLLTFNAGQHQLRS